METKIANSSQGISITQCFGIIGIMLIASLLIAPVQNHLLTISPDNKSWILLFSYVLQFSITLIISMKWQKFNHFDTAKIPLKIYPLSLLFVIPIMIVSESIVTLIPMPDIIAKVFASAVPFDLIGYTMVGLAAPIFEELIFRGLILTLLLRRYTPQKAIIWSAILFGVAHLNPWQFIAAALIGYAIGFIFWKTRNLLICIFIHWFNNTLGFVIGYAYNDMNTSFVDVLPTKLYVILIVISAIAIYPTYCLLNKVFSKS